MNGSQETDRKCFAAIIARGRDKSFLMLSKDFEKISFFPIAHKAQKELLGDSRGGVFHDGDGKS